MAKRKSRSVKYVVNTSCAGPYRNPEFDTFEEALKCYTREILTPSYLRAGTYRKSSILKVTTVSEDVTP